MAFFLNNNLGGSTAPIQTTYDELVALIGESGLTPGGLYGITDFATRHYFVDGAGSQCYDLEDAPAPGNITLTPDAVGDNPVTYYYKVFFNDDDELRSLLSEEIEVIQGDSTTQITLNCDAIPEWAENCDVIRGAETGVYTHYDSGSNVPRDIDINNWTLDECRYVEGFDVKQALSSTTLATNTGTTETIIVQALDVNTLSTHALSVDYPQDVLEYDWNPINWIGDPSFGADGTIIDGWKGVITWREDKTLSNYMQYDYRNVLFRRWTGGYVEYDTATVYSAGDRVLHSDGIIYGAIADITPEEVWTEEHWYKVWDTANGEYWMHTPTGNTGETFDDLPTFGGVAFGNKFEKFVDVSEGMYLLLNNTFLGLAYSNVFGVGCNYNVFGDEYGYNVFGVGCNYNVFGNSCGYNVFGAGCGANVFGAGCGSNVFGVGCNYNVFGDECGYNVFGYECSYMILPASSVKNDFKSGVTGTDETPLDLTASTLVTGDYPVTYTVAADGTIVASYIDTNGKTQIVDALTEIALYKVYKALIFQTNVELTSGTLEVGKTYYISDYQATDDFTNVGAASNETGVTFEATGTTPTKWTNSSVLVDVEESAPTETVIEDTTGVESVWSYIATGEYQLIKEGVFIENKCFPFTSIHYDNYMGRTINIKRIDANTYSLYNENSDGDPADTIIIPISISIEIYP